MTLADANDFTQGSLKENVIIFGSLTIFFGLIVGRMLFRPKSSKA